MSRANHQVSAHREQITCVAVSGHVPLIMHRSAADHLARRPTLASIRRIRPLRSLASKRVVSSIRSPPSYRSTARDPASFRVRRSKLHDRRNPHCGTGALLGTRARLRERKSIRRLLRLHAGRQGCAPGTHSRRTRRIRSPRDELTPLPVSFKTRLGPAPTYKPSVFSPARRILKRDGIDGSEWRGHASTCESRAGKKGRCHQRAASLHVSLHSALTGGYQGVRVRPHLETETADGHTFHAAGRTPLTPATANVSYGLDCNNCCNRPGAPGPRPAPRR